MGMKATREELETPSLWSGERAVIVAQSADLDRLALSISGAERSAGTRVPGGARPLRAEQTGPPVRCGLPAPAHGEELASECLTPHTWTLTLRCSVRFGGGRCAWARMARPLFGARLDVPGWERSLHFTTPGSRMGTDSVTLFLTWIFFSINPIRIQLYL